jgi:hypothetical protein
LGICFIAGQKLQILQLPSTEPGIPSQKIMINAPCGFKQCQSKRSSKSESEYSGKPNNKPCPSLTGFIGLAMVCKVTHSHGWWMGWWLWHWLYHMNVGKAIVNHPQIDGHGMNMHEPSKIWAVYYSHPFKNHNPTSTPRTTINSYLFIYLFIDWFIDWLVDLFIYWYV